MGELVSDIAIVAIRVDFLHDAVHLTAFDPNSRLSSRRLVSWQAKCGFVLWAITVGCVIQGFYRHRPQYDFSKPLILVLYLCRRRRP